MAKLHHLSSITANMTKEEKARRAQAMERGGDWSRKVGAGGWIRGRQGRKEMIRMVKR